MKLHDPFGRMAKRHETRYQSLKGTLESAGIDTKEKAEQTIKQLDHRVRLGLLVVIPTLCLLAFFFQKAAPIVAMFGALIVVWLVQTTYHGKKYIARYIEEELSANSTEPALEDKQD
ncbi:MAG: hypothetical protein ACPGPF_09155 [Pontibacterium sp.]